MMKEGYTMNFPNTNSNDPINFLSANNGELEITTEVLYFEKKIGEHLSFFVKDPNGFKVEFKSFKDSDEIFKK